MAKSLPSLSAFLPTKKNVPDNITDQVLLGCAKKNDEGKQNICLHEMLFTLEFCFRKRCHCQWFKDNK